MQLDGSFIYQSINQSIRQSINQSMSYTIVTNRIQKFWNSPVPLQVVFFFKILSYAYQLYCINFQTPCYMGGHEYDAFCIYIQLPYVIMYKPHSLMVVKWVVYKGEGSLHMVPSGKYI